MPWFTRAKPKVPAKKSFTRIFFATDIHGSEPCFVKFIDAAALYQADVLVLGGDITGKQVVPIEQRWGTHHARLFGQEQVVRTAEELETLESRIRSNGFYPYVATAGEIAELMADAGKMEALLSRLMAEALERWVRLAEERLRGQPVKCFISAGNDDGFAVDAVLQRSDVVICPEGKEVDLDGEHTMVSCGYANMTPWRCPRDVEEADLQARLESILATVQRPSHCIFNLHAPPYHSTLDNAPQVDANLKPVRVGGRPHLIPIGSRAVREMITKYQPLAGLHGHVHECQGAMRLGRTTCVNPGSEYSRGILHGVLLDIAAGRLVAHQFVTS